MGEFRVHYAGFFDPGFGMAETGGHGSRAVLEVRSHKVPFILEDGQLIGAADLRAAEPATRPALPPRDRLLHYRHDGVAALKASCA